MDRSTVLTLLGLTIGDAVNPCALAVLVILLTMLITRDDDPQDVLTAGVSFALAVGVTYLLLGVVLLVYGGFTSSDAVGSWRERNRETFHVVAGIIFVVLGALLTAGHI